MSFTVLLVDDEPDILESLRQVLEAEVPGVRVVVALSGSAALETLAREAVDLVVSDYKMPDMDGLRFLDEVRRVAPGVPRVLMTAYATDALAARARAAEVACVVAKPYEIGAVVDLAKGLAG